MGIDVNIIAGPDKTSSKVNVSGSIQHVITDEEVETFKIGDTNLKNAIKAYFGKLPNDAYLHSETPWGDLYKKYGWEQVQLVFAAESAEILEITSEPQILKTQTFKNNSSKKATFNVAISDTVSNTTSSSWSTNNQLTIGQDFKYGMSFLGTGAEGTSSFSYSQSWGRESSNSLNVTVGSTSGVNIDLEPGESVTAKLSASRGVMKVKIVYNAYLIGCTAVNYNPTYKGHHFWCFPISRVMAAGNILNSNKSIEEIEIGYYSNSSIEIEDELTNNLIMKYSLHNQYADLE